MSHPQKQKNKHNFAPAANRCARAFACRISLAKAPSARRRCAVDVAPRARKLATRTKRQNKTKQNFERHSRLVVVGGARRRRMRFVSLQRWNFVVVVVVVVVVLVIVKTHRVCSARMFCVSRTLSSRPSLTFFFLVSCFVRFDNNCFFLVCIRSMCTFISLVLCQWCFASLHRFGRCVRGRVFFCLAVQ